MRVWVVGSLCFTDYGQFERVLSDGLRYHGVEKVEKLIVKSARAGVPLNALVWAKHNDVDIESVVMCKRDDFRKAYGRRLMNWKVAQVAQCLIVLWDGKSEEVAMSILAAHREELPVYVRTFRQPKVARGVRGRPRNEERDDNLVK